MQARFARTTAAPPPRARAVEVSTRAPARLGPHSLWGPERTSVCRRTEGRSHSGHCGIAAAAGSTCNLARVGTVGWNVVEGLVAVAAALSSGSIALLGFGVD